MNHHKVQTYFYFGILIVVAALVIFMFLPFLTSIVLAATFAVVLRPVFRYFCRILKGSEGWAAFITVILATLIVLGPLSWFGTLVFNEAKDVYVKLSANGLGDLAIFIESLMRRFFSETSFASGAEISRLTANLNDYLQQFLVWVLQNTGAIFSSVARAAFAVLIGMITLYYLLKDGTHARQKIMAISPLSDRHDQEIFNKLARAVDAVVKGVLAIALIQAIMTGVGLAVFGVPHPALWGSVAMLGALIPAIGTSLITVPAVLYLLFTGHIGAGIGLAIWAALGIGLIDNILSPRLMSRGVRVHPLLVLLSVLGGLSLFGPSGFVLGPVVISLLFALLDIYGMVVPKESL